MFIVTFMINTHDITLFNMYLLHVYFGDDEQLFVQKNEKIEYTVELQGGYRLIRRVTFKDDSPNLMQPPCETRLYDPGGPPNKFIESNVEDDVELHKCSNRWVPKSRRN